MRIYQGIFTILLILLINLGCGSNLYLNKTYHFPTNDSFKLAILPIYEDTSAYLDLFLTTAFTFDSLENQEIIPPDEIRPLISEDIEFNAILNKILMADNFKKTNDPNLMGLLDKDEFSKLKEGLNMADVVLIPIKLRCRNILLHTSCDFEFRLYDLRHGDLIYERYGNKTMNVSGEKGKQILSVIIIALVGQEYKEYFVDKYFPKLIE